MERIIFPGQKGPETAEHQQLSGFLSLNTDDDILIADPEGEYAPLIEAMGNIGSVIRVAAGGKDRLNAMYIDRKSVV